MDTNSQITELHERIAKLEARLERYEQFMEIREPDPKTGASGGLHLWCAFLGITHSNAPDQGQAIFASTPAGAQLAFLDDKGLQTISFSNEHGCPHMGFSTRAGEPAIDMAVEPDGGSSVTFKHEGKPRVLISGEPEQGRVIALFDDLRARAALASDAEGGKLLLCNADLRPTVKLEGNSIEGGGGIEICDTAGNPVVALGTIRPHGVVTVLTPDGKRFATFPREGDLEDVHEE